MLLVIDAGNTNITLGVFSGTQLVAIWRLLTKRDKTSEEYGADLRALFREDSIDPKHIEGVAICSVVPPLDEALKCVAEIEFELTPLFVDHTTDTGLKILYDSPSELGADRIVDSAAAVAKYGAPCIVVDCGTATELDCQPLPTAAASKATGAPNNCGACALDELFGTNSGCVRGLVATVEFAMLT